MPPRAPGGDRGTPGLQVVRSLGFTQGGRGKFLNLGSPSRHFALESEPQRSADLEEGFGK